VLKPSGGSPEVYHGLGAEQSSVEFAELGGFFKLLGNRDLSTHQQCPPMPNAVYQFCDLRSPLSPPWWYRHSKYELWK
jgi:hypothetical protein